jgi:tetratricopeptide (TPR) repeat protein
MRLPLLIILATLFTSACASQKAPAPEPVATAPAEAEATPAPVPPAPVPERPIPAASVYPLLAAEFALRRRDYETALDLYREQAPLLRDPAVSAHTTRLAQYLQRGEAALDSARLWAAVAPADPEARDTLATLLMRAGQSPEALPHLVAVAEARGDARFPALLQGFDDLDDEAKLDLEQSLEDLLPRFPESVSLPLTSALIAAEQGQSARAREHLDDVFALEPYQHQALLLEARLLIDEGAARPLRRLEEALAAAPDNDRLRLQYARLLARDDINAARTQFEILSTNNPRDGDVLLSLALINEELGDLVAAKAYLRDLLALGQRPDEAYFTLGRIAEEEEDFRQAIEHYMQVGDSRDFVAANARIGELLLAAGQLARFTGHFTTLRQSYPPRREQLYALQANLLNSAGMHGEALALLDQAIAELPTSTSLLYSRSVAHERTGDIDAAERDLRSILDSEPDNATALNALGYTLANRTQRYEEARALISRALALEPGEPAILDSMGWVLYRQGEFEQALDYLTRAYASFPDPEVAAHLGEVLWATGDHAGARRIWAQALEDDPEHPALRETLTRLGIDDLP